MNIRKFTYLVTPPVLFRLFNKIEIAVSKRGQGTKINGDNSAHQYLYNFRRDKFNYFFDDKIVEDFCEFMTNIHCQNMPIKTNKQKNQAYLNELTDDGYCTISNLFSPSDIKQIHDQLFAAMNPLKERAKELRKELGKNTGINKQEVHRDMQVNYELMSGIIRAWDVEKINPNINIFRHQEDILDICASYFGGNLNESRVYAEYKHIKYEADGNFFTHADTPAKQLKVFLLLNDIGTDNAPFIYYKKSHTINEWRLMRDFLEFSQYNKKHHAFYNVVGPSEMARLATDFPDMSSFVTEVTGKAGDIIIAETYGVHGGSILKKDYRLQLAMGFTCLGGFDVGNVATSIKKKAKDSL